jgi:prepilin-type N-terminal cleavage/methylation domain-containing protein
MERINAVPADGRLQGERGFSLIEVLVATVILTVGLLPLVGVFGAAVQQMGASQPMMQAREKAREAVESVHAARDTGTASWASIRNVADGGVFLDGPRTVRDPGNDGLVNTADDGAVQLPADQFTREIIIDPVLLDNGSGAPNPELREIRVVIRYRVNQAWREYTLTTYVSSYS